jgi:hypothetical protein
LGIQTLQEGIIWRVGSGQSINIWADPWCHEKLQENLSHREVEIC